MAFLFAGLSLTAAVLLKHRHSRRSQQEKGRISSLLIYPVKGLSGYSVQEAKLEEEGFEGDRRYMIVTAEDGRFSSQRQNPVMSQLTAEYVATEAGGKALKLAFKGYLRGVPGCEPITVPQMTLQQVVEREEKLKAGAAAGAGAASAADGSNAGVQRRMVSVWGQKIFDAVDQGDAAAKWISDILVASEDKSAPKAVIEDEEEEGAPPAPLDAFPPSPYPYRLVYMDPRGTIRKTRVPAYVPKPGAETGLSERNTFADGFPFLLASEASLRELNQRLAAKEGPELSMWRFRPNIVVDGAALHPWEEDRWDSFLLGPSLLSFRGVKRCARCTVPTIDPVTGVPGEKEGGREAEPTATMRTYRTDSKGAYVYFGMNLIHQWLSWQAAGVPRAQQVVRVGDPVFVTKYADIRPL